MAENLRQTRPHPRPHSSEAGFSMVEMLMTAFILAIGLLGLAMLQTLSLRAATGSRSLTTGVQVAEGVMDQIEMEGRLTWINLTDTNQAAPVTTALAPQLQYVSLAVTKSATYPAIPKYDNLGQVTTTNPYYTVTVTRVADFGTTADTGILSDFNVLVSFTDYVKGTGIAVPRTVSLTRRILHG